MATGTRHCSANGSWRDPYCESPQSFLDIFTEVRSLSTPCELVDACLQKLLQTQNSPEAALQLLTSAVMNDNQQLTVYQEAFLLLNIYEAQAASITQQAVMSFDQVWIIEHVTI